MVKAEICNASDAPLDQVVDPKNTTRFVRKPAIQPCFLKVRTTEAATLIVEIDGQVVGTHELHPGPNHIPLNLLAQPARSRLLALAPLSRLTGAGANRPAREPRCFTIQIRRGTPEGELLATYNYCLLGEAEFDAAYGNYAREIETPPQPALYTTDERSAETALNCWNCRKPLTPGQCCAQCGCEQHDDEDQQPQ